MDDEIPEPATLPCGCFIVCEIRDGQRQMRISPCQPKCPRLAVTLGMADEAGIEIRSELGA